MSKRRFTGAPRVGIIAVKSQGVFGLRRFWVLQLEFFWLLLYTRSSYSIIRAGIQVYKVLTLSEHVQLILGGLTSFCIISRLVGMLIRFCEAINSPLLIIINMS